MKITEHQIETINIRDIKSLPFNRTISMTHVDKLLTSMYNYGILRLPILVKGKLHTNKLSYWSLDGQHMLAGLYKKDAKSTKCIVVTTEDVPTIVNLMSVVNNSSLKWTLDNYVNAYAALCSKEYEKLRAHKLATGLSFAVSAMLLNESSSCSTIKDGTFKASAKDVDHVTADLIDVISFLGTNNSKFMKAFIRFRRSPNVEYNHKMFMQKLALNKSEVKLVHDEAAMREILINLYK
jgi:hypothetical protein